MISDIIQELWLQYWLTLDQAAMREYKYFKLLEWILFCNCVINFVQIVSPGKFRKEGMTHKTPARYIFLNSLASAGVGEQNSTLIVS